MNIQEYAPLAVALETELCKYPALAPESGGEGELEKCQFLESWLKQHGISQLERYDAPDNRVKSGIRPNLCATIPGAVDSQRLWIISHLDVVPPGNADQWENKNPWQVQYKDGVLIGRGVEDDQQGIVSSVLAALSFVQNGKKPSRTVKLLFTADEENGSTYGMDWLVNHCNLFQSDDLILIPDGGDPEGKTIEIAEKNLLWLKFTVIGKESHGSRPDEGINTHIAAADLALTLHSELSQQFSAHDSLFTPEYSTFQPTRTEENVQNINTIPGKDVFYMDCRILPRYALDTVLTEIHRIQTAIEKKYTVHIQHDIQQAIESPATSAQAPIVQLLSRAIQDVYHESAYCIGIGGGTVAAQLRKKGFEAAIWSRTDNSAHRINEYALLDNILGDAQVMACLMA
ncbi:MAG: M20 family metallo-hydrolase [Treponema sp.]|jgi:succinyl-diaminopimelate desuccinylase|nr:M20 family metallo-hydrolase [Treponema sp.]